MTRAVVVGCCCVAMATAFLVYAFSVARPPRSNDVGGDPGIENEAKMILEFPGIRWPRMLAADDAGLDDAAEIIGICAPAGCRAYAIEALSGGADSHIVNDVIDDVPYSVTYCDLADCARVFTSSSQRGPLDLSVGGIDTENHMILLTDGFRYRQKSSRIPLEEYQFERMSWARWKILHPDTTVYVGDIEKPHATS